MDEFINTLYPCAKSTVVFALCKSTETFPRFLTHRDTIGSQLSDHVDMFFSVSLKVYLLHLIQKHVDNI